MPKNCLIIGSKSSSGVEIEKIFKKNFYTVFGTSRKFKKISDPKKIYLDFANAESLNQFENKIPNLDSVIFCTGMLIGKELIDYKDIEILKVYQANIIGPLMLLSRINKKLNRKCSVVFIGSISGSAGSFDEVYASSKSAINGLIKSLAKKSKKSIRFNSIAPGLIKNSGMYKQFSAKEIENHINTTPTNELNELKKIAKICLNICQDNWFQLNGQNIDINGGKYV